MLKKIFLITFLLIAAGAQASPSRNLTIFAEPNIASALTKIARIYSPMNNVIISINFGSSYNLISNIDSGEPVDIFISAHKGWIESLHQKGVVDVYNVGYIAQDNLVLATLKTNSNIPEELQKGKISPKQALTVLNESKATIILDEEGNSAGYYAKKFLDELALSNLKNFSKLAEDKTPLLSIIRNSPTSYALLLESQINNKSDFQIIARDDKKDIFYQALVIAGDNMDTAREFLKFLKSEQAKNILKNSGFVAN